MKFNKVKLLVVTALFTALCVVCTMFVSVPMPGTGGYIHFGDAIIMLAATLLPRPFSIFVGAVGGALADVFVAPVWAPYTLVIKALVALCISHKKQKTLTVRNVIGVIVSFAITIGGYYLAESLIYGNWIAPVASMIGNLIQCVGSAIIFVLLSLALDKMNFKTKTHSLIK